MCWRISRKQQLPAGKYTKKVRRDVKIKHLLIKKKKKKKRLSSLTRNAVFTFPLHLQRLYIDAPVPDKSRACNSSVRLTEALFMNPTEHKTRDPC